MGLAYKHIIWDWNGTLLNDTWLCLDIMNGQLQKIGRPMISFEEYQRLFDFPVRNFYEKIGFDFSKDSYESVALNFIREYTGRRFSCTLHFGVPAMLTKLHQAGCGHSVLSAYAEEELFVMLDHFKVRGHFSHVIGLNNHYASGKVEEGRLLLERLAMPLNELVLIGDTKHDFQVAQELGLACILVANGHNSRLRLEECGVPVVKSFSEAMLLTVS